MPHSRISIPHGSSGPRFEAKRVYCGERSAQCIAGAHLSSPVILSVALRVNLSWWAGADRSFFSFLGSTCAQPLPWLFPALVDQSIHPQRFICEPYHFTVRAGPQVPLPSPERACMQLECATRVYSTVRTRSLELPHPKPTALSLVI